MRDLKFSEPKPISLDDRKPIKKIHVVILLDNIRSLHNVGSIFRTADAFGVDGLLLCGITGTPPHREIQKTALGATDSIPWTYAARAVTQVIELKKQGYTIIAVEQTPNSIPLQTLRVMPSKKYCLIVGNEVDGVAPEIINQVDSIVEINQCGIKNSLNVSVCLGIVVWELYRKT